MAETKSVRANSKPKKPVNREVQPSEELRRSPEIQAEVERIGKADTYLVLDRDVELFDWLDDQRDAKLCSYVVAAQGSGLPKACQFYRMKYVRRRGALLEIPAPVLYIDIYQHGRPTDLYRSILEEFGHPLATLGTLRDLRSRTLGTLKSYGVKILIIGNADLLSLESFNELIEIFNKLRIPVILAGSYYLHNVLSRSSLPYIRVHDSFLDFYDFPNLSQNDIIDVVDDWSEKFLPSDCRLHLTAIPGLVEFLRVKSDGLLESVYDLIRKIAILKLDEPDLELNQATLAKRFSRRKQPKVKL